MFVPPIIQYEASPRPFALVIPTRQPGMRSARVPNAFTGSSEPNAAARTPGHSGKLNRVEQQSPLCVFIPTGNSTGAGHALLVLGRAAVRAHGYLVGHVRGSAGYRITTVIVSVPKGAPRLPSWKGSVDRPGLSLFEVATRRPFRRCPQKELARWLKEISACGGRRTMSIS